MTKTSARFSNFNKTELTKASDIASKLDWSPDDRADIRKLLLSMGDEISRLYSIVNQSEIALMDDNEVVAHGVYCHIERMTEKAIWTAIHHDYTGNPGKGRLVLWFKSESPIEITSEWDDD